MGNPAPLDSIPAVGLLFFSILPEPPGLTDSLKYQRQPKRWLAIGISPYLRGEADDRLSRLSS